MSFPESSTEHETRIDPDPWTLISLGIATVAMFGTLGQLALVWQHQPPSKNIVQGGNPAPMREHLKDALESAVKSCERLLRFLAKLPEQPADPAQQPFMYGETVLMLDYRNFGEFDRLGLSLSHDVTSVHQTVMMMIKHHPSEAAKLGHLLIEQVADIKSRVNGFYDGRKTNEQVLSDCLSLLRIYIALLTRLEDN